MSSLHKSADLERFLKTLSTIQYTSGGVWRKTKGDMDVGGES